MTVVYVASLPSLASATLAMLLPLSVRFIYETDQVHVVVGLALLGLIAVILRTGAWMNRVNSESLLLRFDKNQLIESLSEEKHKVTEIEKGEKALRASEDRLHRVLREMPVLMQALDEHGNIVVWNRECERVTGYSAEETIGNPSILEQMYPDCEGLGLARKTVGDCTDGFRVAAWRQNP